MNRALLILSCLCVSLSVAGRGGGGWPDFHGPPFGGGGGHHGGHGGFPGFPDKFPRGGDKLAEKYCGDDWLLLTAPEVDRDNLKPGDKIECFKIYDKYEMSAFLAEAFLRRHGLQLLAIDDGPMLVRVLKALIHNGWKTDGENMAWLAGFQVSDRLFVTQNGSLVSPLLSKHYGCTWSEFGEPSQCSIVDEKCVRTRERCKLVEEAEHGTCTGEATEVEECDAEDCESGPGCDVAEHCNDHASSCSINPDTKAVTCVCEGDYKGDKCQNLECKLDVWGGWTACSVTCGGGKQTRTKPILVEGEGDGVCDPNDYKEERACNEAPCLPPCPSGWNDVTKPGDTKPDCTKVINSAKKWEDAKRECENIGAHLVTIDSNEMFEKLKATLGTSTEKYWVGFKLSGIPEAWRAVNDNTEILRTNSPFWADNEPGSNIAPKKCAFLQVNDRQSKKNGLANAFCDHDNFKYKYICEKNP